MYVRIVVLSLPDRIKGEIYRGVRLIDNCLAQLSRRAFSLDDFDVVVAVVVVVQVLVVIIVVIVAAVLVV